MEDFTNRTRSSKAKSQAPTTEEPFRYRPLNKERKEIRLLVLESTDENSPLRCKLRHFSLRDVGKIPRNSTLARAVIPIQAARRAAYNAISYCWGENPERREILIDGKTALVPESAIHALRVTNFPADGKQDLPVWIDAICINQADDDEKSHQVSMMGEIYTRAAHVLICLGDEEETTQSAIKNIRFLAQATRNFGEEEMRDPPPSVLENLLPMEAWTEIAQFFDSAWFLRLWTQQESILPRSALYYRGPRSIGRAPLVRISPWLRNIIHNFPDLYSFPENSPLLAAKFTALIYVYWYLHEHPGHISLYQVSFLGWLCETTDPRDRVFAILGLLDVTRLSASCQQLLRPDYSLSVGEVYLRATKAMILEDKIGSFSLLTQLHHPECRYRIPEEREGDTLGVPSWVFRFDMVWRSEDFVSGVRSDGVACSHESASPIFDPDQPDVLQVHGVAIGEVIWCSPIVPSYWLNSGEEKYDGMKKVLAPLWNLTDETTIGTEERVRTVASCFYMEDPDDFKKMPISDSAPDYGSLMMSCQADCPGPLNVALAHCLTRIGAAEGDSQRFAENAIKYTHYRHLVFTSTGYCGMAPTYTKPGDIVCILSGCHYPVTLRPKGKLHNGAEGEYWELLGQTFVPGIMDASTHISIVLHRETCGH